MNKHDVTWGKIREENKTSKGIKNYLVTGVGIAGLTAGVLGTTYWDKIEPYLAAPVQMAFDMTFQEPAYKFIPREYTVGQTIEYTMKKGKKVKIYNVNPDAIANEVLPQLKEVNQRIDENYLLQVAMPGLKGNEKHIAEWPYLKEGDKFIGPDVDRPYIKK